MIYIPYFIFSYTCGSAREFKKSDGSHVASESMTCQVWNDNDDNDDDNDDDNLVGPDLDPHGHTQSL